MYDKPHPVAKEQILLALDHVLEQNPSLRVVGAHLGSMEADLDAVAQHLDRYPNFAVDLSGRIPYLALHPRPTVIAFILEYQDRLIYGSDLEFSPRSKLQPRMHYWEEFYANDWRFLATRGTVEFEGVKGQGLALPESVLRKIYHDNAVRWFPSIYVGAH
jgi:predicted TIM-barrel fold metal-dependent hydrolase